MPKVPIAANLPSRARVRKAGQTLREWWDGKHGQTLIPGNVSEALDILDAYRAAHHRPLNAATTSLRSMARTRGVTASISQRLKRHFSIIIKLHREPTMDLTRMQDIGGCRAVVDSLDALRSLRDRWYADKRTRERIRREYDYVANPKTSGYRGVHLSVLYDGHLIEVRLRTQIQHEWSIAVERVGGRIQQDLKGSRGPVEVLEFFGIVSRAMELEERGEIVPPDLLGEVREARRRAEPLMKRRPW